MTRDEALMQLAALGNEKMRPRNTKNGPATIITATDDPMAARAGRSPS